MENEEVCYTREVALEKAIEMEMKSFQTYKETYLKIREPRVKDLVKDLALEELAHKYILEKAYFEETVALHQEGMNEGPSMKLSLLLKEKPLEDDADDQDVMIHAIHDEKRAVDFYKKMAEQCAGAPMEEMFEKLTEEEENHLARLEKMYENVYMKDN
ncbi:MAG: ferritin family protein [Desulfobulbaceae bacterium]|nr:ferritin family protein [Desulfobulbaceae bacterium]